MTNINRILTQVLVGHSHVRNEKNGKEEIKNPGQLRDLINELNRATSILDTNLQVDFRKSSS